MRLVTFVDWLTKFSGEDFAIVKKCERKFQIRFALVGLFVLVIFLGCFLSCAFAVYSFFEHNLLLSIPIGLFFGWMVVNIYLLLLYTLTPNLLTEAKEEGLAALSLALRLSFIMLLAVILARPISVWVFHPYLQEDVDRYKKELLISHTIQADSLLIEQEKVHVKRYVQDMGLSRSLHQGQSSSQSLSVLLKVSRDTAFLNKVTRVRSHIDLLAKEPIKNRRAIDALKDHLYLMAQEEYEDDSRFLAETEFSFLEPGTAVTKVDSLNLSLQKKIQALVEKKKSSQGKLLSLLESSSFFVYKVKVVSSRYLFSWLIDAVVIIIFFLPVYWKYVERKLLRYYAERKQIEKQIVIDEYGAFKHYYAMTMKSITGKEIQFYEPFVDPPFNTIRKKDNKELKPQEEFLKKIYGLG